MSFFCNESRDPIITGMTFTCCAAAGHWRCPASVTGWAVALTCYTLYLKKTFPMF